MTPSSCSRVPSSLMTKWKEGRYSAISSPLFTSLPIIVSLIWPFFETIIIFIYHNLPGMFVTSQWAYLMGEVTMSLSSISRVYRALGSAIHLRVGFFCSWEVSRVMLGVTEMSPKSTYRGWSGTRLSLSGTVPMCRQYLETLKQRKIS